MSDVIHIINLGAIAEIEIDASFLATLLPVFTFDRDDITFDSNLRRFDETP